MKQESYEKTIKLLEKYKLPLAKSKLVNSLNQALKIGNKIGYPLVIKAISPKIVHKTDQGAVITGINNEEELEKEYNNLMKKIKRKKSIKLEGVLIQKQEHGEEIIIGLKNDPNFGKFIMFGLGGIFVEILEDVAFRIPPIDKKEAIEMIKELKGYKILEGARGKKPADIDALAKLIVKISSMADDPKIEEIEFNPVMVDEKGVVVVDTRLIKN